jgi:hypothetical protein
VADELNPSDHPSKDVRAALKEIFAADPGEWQLVAGRVFDLGVRRG